MCVCVCIYSVSITVNCATSCVVFVFCIVCSFAMFVVSAIRNLMVKAYSSIGFVLILNLSLKYHCVRVEKRILSIYIV